MLKENSKDVIKIGNNILDGSYINKNKKAKLMVWQQKVTQKLKMISSY